MKQSNSSMRSEQKDKNLEHHFNQLKQENMNSSFPEVESWLFKAAINIESNKNLTIEKFNNERKLHKMKIFFFGNKLRLVYTIIAFAVIIGACNMPVTQTESAGKMITLVVAKDNTTFQAKMNELPWIKNVQVTSNDNTNNGRQQTLYRIVLPNTTEEQVKAYADEMEKLGSVVSIKISSMDYDVKRPLYSAALHDFFSVDINATGMSDEELQKDIESKLNEQGVDMKFFVKTGADGKREIMVERDSKLDVSKEPKSFEINVEDDNGKEKIKMMTKKADPEKFKGKTDQEIRDLVRKDTGNPDLKDSDIIIERKGDEVLVKVDVERKE